MGSNMQQKGIEFIRSAVAKDEEEEFEEALKLYQRGINYLMKSLKYEQNESRKEMITDKIKGYLTRAEQIKQMLLEPAPSAAGVVTRKRGGPRPDGGADGTGDEPKGDAESEKLKSSVAQAIVMEKPNIKWSDVAGLENAKSMLKEAVILPVKFPQLFTGKLTPWKGILLYGPPGTGKSFLAKAVATEADNSTFLSVSSADLMSKYQGESEKLVRQLFELAREKAPSIIFIDEIDSLCGARGDGENDSARRVKTEFLVQMQGVGKNTNDVLVLGATNLPWGLDSAIRRRFEKRIYIPLPDIEARKVMLKLNIGDTPNTLTDRDLDTLAERCDGFSGADMNIMVRSALIQPLRTMQTATHFKRISQPDGDYVLVPCSPADPAGEEMSLFDVPDPNKVKPLPLTMNDFLRALAKAKPSVGEADICQHVDWTREFGEEG
ncbi:MAG: hypothetical protein MHM6MM_002215 [Cercozoa sp. M6MM]